MKIFSNTRRAKHIKPRKIALIVTTNDEYKETDEYKEIKRNLSEYVINTVVYHEDIQWEDINKRIDTLKRENDIRIKNGDRIIFLEDLSVKGVLPMKE